MLAFWWKLFINNKELSPESKYCIQSINTSNPIHGSDTIEISITDPNMVYIEDDLYVDNVPVRYEFGVYNTLFSKVFEGYISAIDIDFPTEGQPTLKVTCMDKSHIMNREKKKRSFENTTNADVVQKIAKEYGFKCVVESGYPFKKEESISQDNSTDLEFIEGLADNEDEAFYCKLIGDTIYYCKKGLVSQPVVRLAYRSSPYDLLSFSPKITIEDKEIEVNSADVNSSSLQTVSSTVTPATSSSEKQGEKQSTTSITNTTTEAGDKHVFNASTGNWEVS